MRRQVSRFAALCASLALAVPSYTLPLHAQDRLNREQAIQLCVERTGSQERDVVGACVIEEFVARGQQEAAQLAREELGLTAEAPAEQAPAPLSREQAIQICVDRLNSQDRQTVGACVADEFEADGQADQAANIRATLAQEAEEARAAAEAQAAAEEARQAEEQAAEAQAAEEARRAEEQAAEAQAAEEARRAEEQAAAEAARQAEEARLTRDEAIQICVDRLNSQDRQTVGTCVAEEFEAAGQTAQADRIRTVLAEEAAAAEAARAAQEQAEAETAETADEATATLTREAARDACDARLGREGRAELRGCVADTLAADGQTELAERVRAEAEAAQSRVADEVAARGEPELTEQEQQAADRTGAALDGEGSAAAANDETAEGDVVEETVTADDVRSSSEDFQTGAVVSDDDDGLSRNQKIALGALGALAVGALLSNRSRVVSNSGDRVVVQRDDGDLQVLKDDDALLRQPGSNVRTENFDDGSSRTVVTREDGSRVVTVRDASLRVLRRTLIDPDGEEYVLIDDTDDFAPVDVSQLPSQPLLTAPAGSALDPLAGLGATRAEEDPLRDALRREAGLPSSAVDRRFSLNQVRNIPEVRALAPAFEVADVTFASGSAAIAPEQARNLTDLARLVLDAIAQNPREVFLIEGHTDAVGDAAYNLALSDRRAESLALALNEYFRVPVENMVVQGYGEQFLKVPTLADERANRRATVRQITGLLRTAAAN